MKIIQDHYFNKAKREKYVARSVYKLEEIQVKKRLLKKGDRVADLGCSPGSWLQYASSLIGNKGFILGIDIQPFSILPTSNMNFMLSSVDLVKDEEIYRRVSGFDAVLSDMAAKSTGVKNVDAENAFLIAEMALCFSQKYLKPKGTLLMKTFSGSAFARILSETRAQFSQVQTIKPKSSRSESKEVFLLAQQKK